MIFKVEVADLLIKVIDVEASSKEEAKEKAKNCQMDSRPYSEGGNRISRKFRVFKNYAYAAKYYCKGSENHGKCLEVIDDNGYAFSDKGTEFEDLNKLRDFMNKVDNDKRHWKIIHLKRS